MKPMRVGMCAVLLFALATPALAQKRASFIDGDYGPVLSVCMEAAGRKLKDTTNIEDTVNYVFRGRLISLSKDKSINVCFDTEHLRWAAAWSGGFIDWVGATKNMGPTIKGDVQFTTKVGPGWAKDGKWEDPREPKEGPLPRDWARYNGMYLHGDRVVVVYSVGGVEVLELPGAASEGDVTAFTRSLRIGKADKPMAMLICEADDAKGDVNGDVATLTTNEGVIAATFSAVPQGTTWEATNGRIHLKLPALPEGALLRVTIARLAGTAKLNALTNLNAAPLEDPAAFTKPGPPRFPQVLTTKGMRGSDKHAYTVDDITLPTENPWNAWIRPGGMDFFADGRVAFCTWDGDVWIASGLDDKLDNVQWRRFATGLHQPLGLKIVDGVIHTAGRDQITRLHDTNKDGEADYYENINNEPGLTLQRHEFVMDLHTDAAGNFYYCRSGHYIAGLRGENCCVIRVSKDGSKMEVFARGFREANGMSIGPDGFMTVGDNEGNGVPQTPIYHLKQGGDYGFTPPEGLNRRGGKWSLTQAPIVWIPKQVDRSAGSQVWVTSDKWGPFTSGLMHTSYGHCALYAILLDRASEPYQGAVIKFPLSFSSGVMRARFGPHDGQLYLCGLKGWDTAAAKDGQLCRVRYTGKPLSLPVGWRVTKTGFEITFAHKLDKELAEDVQSYGGKWHSREELKIAKATLLPDGRTVALEIGNLQKAMNLLIQYNVESAEGDELRGDLYATVNRLP